MNKRKHKRFVITLQAQVIIGGKSYDGIISNVSEEGVSSTITTFINTDDHFSLEKEVSLNFDLPAGDPVNLQCETRWYLRPRENDKKIMLGLYITDPPPEYTEWIKKFR